MMTNNLVPSYPSDEHLEGNFITFYVNHYTFFDRYIVKMFGERAIEVDRDVELSDVAIEWTYDSEAIIFTHLNDWAKMYSALIKDYEPLWNVDGTVTTTYGETEDNDTFGATKLTDQYGATQETMQYGATQKTNQFGATQDTLGAHNDTITRSRTAYPSSTTAQVETEGTQYGSQVNSSIQHTDVESELLHSDVKSGVLHTDEHSTIQHADKHTSKEHIDTERRTGNIGVTKSTELVESEARLRTTWNFYKIIFSYILKEIGVHYYD